MPNRPFGWAPPASKPAPRAQLSHPRSFPGLAPGGIAGLGFVIGRVKAGQLHSFLDLAKDPAFTQLVFGAFVSDEVDQILRNYHRTVIIHDNHVTGKHGAAATADRLLPTDKSQAIDRCRSGNTGTPHWKCARQNAGA